ncbi:MAG: HEPN domain-containing protein [Oscillospiraceae bacterium]|jgi:HEPN domain-containing protein|nr:HEPN domain-containing protein [Oscillospiraceae bacterium]
MNNIDKVKYWIDLAKEDFDVAKSLYSNGKYLYCGFFCHISVEKALKARIESIGLTPLKSHNLIKLAELGSLEDIMTSEQTDLLYLLNPLQMEARYPTYKQQLQELLTSDYCIILLNRTEEIITWIEKQL